MPRKAKPTKHSTKSLDKKRKLATQDKGGGKKGKEARRGKTGGAKFTCYVCFKHIPDEKTMTIHFESKHSKLTLDMEKCKVNDTKKDQAAVRERIRETGPALSAGKKMTRREKKKAKDKKDAEAKQKREDEKAKKKKAKDEEKAKRKAAKKAKQNE